MFHEVVHMVELVIIHLERTLISFPIFDGVHNLIQIALGLLGRPQNTGPLEEPVMVPPALFYKIERLISPSVKLLKLSSVHPGDTDADRKLRVLKHLYLILLFAESLQKLFHLLRNDFLVRDARQIIQKLIPAGPADNLVSAYIPQHVCDYLQGIISHQMTVHVINVTEMIQINQH